jgi:zinc protease
MGWLLDALDSTKYDRQREVVQNERRQSYDNQPSGHATEILLAAMFPSTNPYSWPVIGSMADLQAAPIEAVKDFFRLYYAPNNATLVIVGDFGSAQAKAWVTKYFAGISRGQTITRPTVPMTTLPAEKRLVFEDRVQLPRLYLWWPAVGDKSGDKYALDILADVLTKSRLARLTKALVYDKQSVATLNGVSGQDELAGDFGLMITPRPGHSLTDIEADIDSLVATLKRDGPTDDEVKRAIATRQLAFVTGIESNLGKAQQLARGQTFHNDPNRPLAVDYAGYQAVTAADVKRVANTYLVPGRVVLSIVPMGKRDQASKPAESTLVTDNATTTKGNTPEGK